MKIDGCTGIEPIIVVARNSRSTIAPHSIGQESAANRMFGVDDMVYGNNGSPDLVVMGGDSCSKRHEFESRHCILDGHFSRLFVEKIVMCV